MATTQEKLIAYAPQYDPASADDPVAAQLRLDIFLEDATLQLGVQCFADNIPLWTTALAYLAAHNLTLADRGASGATGPVTGERAGEVAIQYAQTPAFGKAGGLHSTPYGMALDRILRSRACTHMFTTGFTFPQLHGRNMPTSS